MISQRAVQHVLSAGSVTPERILFGRSNAMREVRDRVDKVAKTSVPVLIYGETGVGKEAIARYVHSQSPWRDCPFVRINCPGIPGTSLEKLLASYEKPSENTKETPGEGTLFFDDIGGLELSLQSTFLDFLQDSYLPRIDGNKTLCSNFRIICAATRPLEAEIESGRFRRDLYYRINVVTIHVPPLRERQSDIPDLIDFFLQRFSAEFDRVPHPIRPATRKRLVTNDWPGNIRQLENLIKCYVILGTEDAINGDVSNRGAVAPSSSSQHDISLKQVTRSATRDLERKVILDALAANHWNRTKTAAALHISYRALLYKIKQNGLPTRGSSAAIPENFNE